MSIQKTVVIEMWVSDPGSKSPGLTRWYLTHREERPLKSYPGTPYPATDVPVLGRVVQGDPAEKAMSKSSQPCSCDQRAGFEYLVTIKKIVHSVFMSC